jgi:dihydroorotase-like cyclic amidohydrolase
MDKIIRNGNVVISYEGVKQVDIGMKDGKIVAIGSNLTFEHARSYY